jgi:hypothetical protein
MLAYCGLDCSGCPIYRATRVEDPQAQKRMREAIVVQIERLYGMKCRVEDITDCDGCAAVGGRLFAGCRMCGIRPCAQEKGFESCAPCSEYVCAKLQEFFDHGGKLLDMDAKNNLDAIRRGLRRDGV